MITLAEAKKYIEDNPREIEFGCGVFVGFTLGALVYNKALKPVDLVNSKNLYLEITPQLAVRMFNLGTAMAYDTPYGDFIVHAYRG